MQRPEYDALVRATETFRPLLKLRLLWSALTPSQLIAVTALLVGVTRIALKPFWVHCDVAMYLQGAQLLLHGKWPCVGFMDVNPPLIVYLSVFPVLLAEGLHTHVVPTTLGVDGRSYGAVTRLHPAGCSSGHSLSKTGLSHAPCWPARRAC